MVLLGTWMRVDRGVGEMHLHPISETYQFRPTMTYLDLLSRKTAPTVGDEEEEEEEVPAAKPAGAAHTTAKEIVVSARDATAGASVGGLSALRRELISTLRKEQDEKWVDLEWHEQDVSDDFFDDDGFHGSNRIPCPKRLSKRYSVRTTKY